MSAVWRNKCSTVHFSLKPSTATTKDYLPPFPPPPPTLYIEAEETWDCMVVPLNHLGVELHKAINTNYSETRERRAGRGQTSYYLSFPLQLSSSLEQEADSRSGGWTVHCVNVRSLKWLSCPTVVSTISSWVTEIKAGLFKQHDVTRCI